MPQEKYDRPTSQKLLLRRQFILGPRFIEGLKSWEKINVRTTICLTVHPDLNTHHVIHNNKSITLLGYLLDPTDPQAQDANIISNLMRKLDTCDNLDDFFEHTDLLGGRWILIIDDGKEIRLFNDATGLRQVFYTDTRYTNDIWCASQPGLIAEVLSLETDKGASDFMNSVTYKNNREYWWPGDTSPYKEIKHLLPNHDLDLQLGCVNRFWPNKNLTNLSLQEGLTKISTILTRLMKSAHNRFDLAFTLTAGWDSRLLLAAAKEIHKTLWYFTLLIYELTENSPDIQIPVRLLAKLDLNHHIIKCPPRMDHQFKKIYMRNVTTAHDAWGKIAQGMYNHYPQNRICIKGNASEIARCFYRLPKSIDREVTAQDLTVLTKMGANPFAIKSFDKWLRNAKEIYNVNVLDLFYWEQRIANWQAMSQLEWDIVQEVFTPYNCRSLITNMLSVDEQFRDHDEPILYKELIRVLWPDLLSEPVNPPVTNIVSQKTYLKKKARSIERRIKTMIKNIIVKTPIMSRKNR